MTDLILMMLKLPFGIGGIAYGGLIQILCSVGMHHTVTPIIVSIFTETGVDYINPMGSAAIAGQLGAGLAIVMMQKNKQKRANMIPALIPALSEFPNLLCMVLHSQDLSHSSWDVLEVL